MPIIELPWPLVFDWDYGNQTKSLFKHGVSNEFTEDAFQHPAYLGFDPEHSGQERRFNLIGKIAHEHILFIVFTIRNNRVRIISSRLANKREREIYEEEVKKAA